MHKNCAAMITAQEGCWQDNCFSAAVFFGAWIVGSRSFCQSFETGWKDCLTKRTRWNNIPHPKPKRFQHAVPSSFLGGKEHQPHFWVPFLHLRSLNYQCTSTDHAPCSQVATQTSSTVIAWIIVLRSVARHWPRDTRIILGPLLGRELCHANRAIRCNSPVVSGGEVWTCCTF